MQFDCLIQGGTIVDGSGYRAPYPGDIGIVGDRIVAVGDLDGAQAARVIDAHDRVVSPGFIDVHVHSEISLLGGQDQMAGVRQGITTNLMSPDGFGWAPLRAQDAREMWRYTQFIYGSADLSLDWPSVEDYLDLFVGRIPANVYPQVPHGTVRLRAMGWTPRPAIDEEQQVMIHATREWMDAGAGALSLGLDYQPGANARLRELVTLARTVASYGGVYAAHIRSQLLGTVGAWQESIEISRQTGVPVHISHARVDAEVERLLDQVEREDINLTFESYLYPAGMTHLALYLPIDVQAGSLDNMLERMSDPRIRQRCLDHLRGKLGAVGDQIVGYTGSGRYVGMTLSEAAQSAGLPWTEFVYDLIVDEAGMETFTVPWLITGTEREQTLRRTAVHPRMMIASDGVYGIPHPHPRGYGCFVHVLRRFVRELKLLSLEQAIYKMSGFPAQRFGLKDRGQIVNGNAADLVVFDPQTIADRSTWQEPRRTPVGVEWVIVNGELAIESGTPTGNMPGRLLRRSD
jgi:N-acyl-D-aspartate/D-glutamate deacylase